MAAFAVVEPVRRNRGELLYAGRGGAEVHDTILNCRIGRTNRAHFQGWEDREKRLPCHRRTIDILRRHGI